MMETLTEEFGQLVRAIVREELEREKAGSVKEPPLNQSGIPGLTQKPLYNMREVRQLFGNVSIYLINSPLGHHRRWIFQAIKAGNLLYLGE